MNLNATDDPATNPQRYRFVFERESMVLGKNAVGNFADLSDEERTRLVQELKSEATERRKKTAALRRQG